VPDSSVWRQSATALAEPSSRPALRGANDSNGMTTTLTDTSTMPTTDCSGSRSPSAERAAHVGP
jgi:hypothetical protein